MKISLVASAMFLMMCISSVHLLTLKALPKRKCKLRSDVGKAPQIPQLEFLLDKNTAVGPGLSVSDDGKTGIKSTVSHTGVLGTKSFNKGKTTWVVKLHAKKPFAGEYWIMLGVSTNNRVGPSPSQGGIWGVSVSHNRNGWRSINGGVSYYREGANYAEYEDVITVTLDADEGTLNLSSKQFKEEIKGLPKGQNFWPYFDAYDVDFTLQMGEAPQEEENGNENEDAADFNVGKDAAPCNGLTFSKDGSSILKSIISFCAVKGSKSYDSGVVTWSVKMGAKTKWGTEYWMLLGVTSTPNQMPHNPQHGNPGLYAMSVTARGGGGLRVIT